jgi:hypothetical protein
LEGEESDADVSNLHVNLPDLFLDFTFVLFCFSYFCSFSYFLKQGAIGASGGGEAPESQRAAEAARREESEAGGGGGGHGRSGSSAAPEAEAPEV